MMELSYSQWMGTSLFGKGKEKILDFNGVFLFNG